MTQKPGRNDPCPCGSGKKYKRCCGSKDSIDSRFLPDDQMTGTPMDEYFFLLPFLAIHEQKVTRFEKDGPEYKKARHQVEKRYRPGAEDGILDSHFMSWLYFDHRFGKSQKTLAERVLEDPLIAKLVEPGPTCLRQMAESYLTFYEVLESGPDVVLLGELGTGKRWSVFYFRELFNSTPETGEIWYTRLIGPPERALSYTTPYIYDPVTRGQFERGVRGQVDDFFKSPVSIGVPAERLYAESQKASALFWFEYILISNNAPQAMLSSVPSEWPKQSLPRIVNTDREDLIFTEMHFRVKDEKAARKKLATLRSFDHDEKHDSWEWLKGKSRVDPDEPRTVLGSFKFRDGRLVAETNSRERAARLEAKLDWHLRGLLILEKTLYRQLDDPPPIPPEELDALRKEDDEFNARPEVQDALRQYSEKYYFEKWPRKRVPALGNITPLQAAKTEKGRQKLEALLDYMGRLQDGAPDTKPRVDIDKLRRMLGLPPKAG